jgi:hypothetical protein
MQPFLNSQFAQVALPLIVTIIVAGWFNNRGTEHGFQGVHKRLDDIVGRITAIEARLLLIETRLTAVERKVDALETRAWR